MSLAADFRSASRNVRRGGWLPATVVVILALAIGVVTAIFSIAHAVLIRPLPVADPDRVMLLWGRDDARAQQVVEVSLLDHQAWLAGQKMEVNGKVTVTAGADLSQLKQEDISVTKQGDRVVVTVNVPAPQVFSAEPVANSIDI